METELQQRNLIRRIWSHVSSYFQFSAPNVNESSRSGAHAGGKQWYRYSGFQKKARREIVQRFSAAQQSAVFASLAAKVFFCFLSILLVCQNHVSLLPGMSTKCVCFQTQILTLRKFSPSTLHAAIVLLGNVYSRSCHSPWRVAWLL